MSRKVQRFCGKIAPFAAFFAWVFTFSFAIFSIYHEERSDLQKFKLNHQHSTHVQEGEFRIESSTTELTTQQKNVSILILVVLNSMNEFSKYETALASLRCYARMHNYEFRIAVSAHFLQCFTRDFMFARHCIVAEHLYIADYTLFLDADMAVVSPKRKIEEWIDPRFDLTLYERFINFEIAAGSYIAKNTKWTFDFLKKFAKYGDELEEKVVGSDNAALHMFLADELYPEMRDEFEPCRKAQQKVKWGIDLYVYEVCVRMTIGNQLYMKNVRMLRKGTGWVRDVWLADSRWSPDRDFILHGLQEARVENFTGQFVERAKLPWMRKAFYYKLFNKIPDIHKCYDPDYDFDLDERFIKSKAEVDEILREIKADVDESKWNFAGMLPNFIDF